MNFRIFFFLSIFVLTSNSYSQWWVDGGNLTWPYGNVKLKGDFITGRYFSDLSLSTGIKVDESNKYLYLSALNFDLSYDSNSRIHIDSSSTNFYDYANIIWLSASGIISNSDFSLTMGDVWVENNGTRIVIDDNTGNITLDANSGFLDVRGDVVSNTGIFTDEQVNGTQINVQDVARKINLSADSVNISGNLSVAGDTMYIASKFFLPGYSFDLYNLDLLNVFQITPQRKTTLGDINGDVNNTVFSVDDNNVTISAHSYINNNQSLITRIGDYAGNNNGTYIYIEDDGDAKINLNADSVNISGNLSVDGGITTKNVVLQDKGYFIGGNLDLEINNLTRIATIRRNDLMQDVSLFRWASTNNQLWLQFPNNFYSDLVPLPSDFICHIDTGAGYMLGMAKFSTLIYGGGADTVIAISIWGDDFLSQFTEADMERVIINFGFFLTPENDVEIGYDEYVVEP